MTIVPESRHVMVKKYAGRLVNQAISLQPGQDLFIRGREELHDFALLVGDAAYRAGAKSVRYNFPRLEELKQLITMGSFEQIRQYHEGVMEFYAEIVKRGAASITLLHGIANPTWSDEIGLRFPENHDFFFRGMGKINTLLCDYVRCRRFPHAAVPVAVVSWAERVFPESDDPLGALWGVIDHASEAMEEKAGLLKAREEMLNRLEIRELHIIGGGNDLKLALSAQARWIDVALKTQYGQRFHPNFPSHEIFSVPDCRVTEGQLVASMPFRLNDYSMVEGLSLTFSGGRVSSCKAKSGMEQFEKWLKVDAGACMVGEIGLVGSDAPLYGVDRFFDFIHFDENVASHIALGLGISFALADSEKLSDGFLASIGCNTSAVHTDIMFGSPEVSVVATRTREGRVVLLEGGVWQV